jgi:hypothetical protein
MTTPSIDIYEVNKPIYTMQRRVECENLENKQKDWAMMERIICIKTRPILSYEDMTTEDQTEFDQILDYAYHRALGRVLHDVLAQ